MHLTKRQAEILAFITKFRARRGFSPTLEETGEHFGVNKVTVHEHISALVRKGAVQRARAEARSVVPMDEKDYRPVPPLPLVGEIAAGEPIEAIEDRQVLDVAEMLASEKERYVLRVAGNSMIDEQICDGDYVIVEKRQSADNGETAVALLEDGSATLKKIYRENGQVRLQPANADMQPIYVDNVQVQGVVIGVLRKY